MSYMMIFHLADLYCVTLFALELSGDISVHLIHNVQGIGSKVLKQSGWVLGSGVGATNQGIAEPVESEGQHPSNKRGLGYGEI